MKEGDRVKLKANEEEGWVEEEGTLLEIRRNGATVELDKKYRENKHDDGLRDVTLEQLESLED